MIRARSASAGLPLIPAGSARPTRRWRFGLGWAHAVVQLVVGASRWQARRTRSSWPAISVRSVLYSTDTVRTAHRSRTQSRSSKSSRRIVSWASDNRPSISRGPRALLQLREPVNKFPDLVRAGVRRLKLLCARLGKDKIAEMFCRAGVEISASTVSRIVKERGPATPPPAIEPALELVRAKRPNDAWLIDLTAVPIGGFGFWVRWLPFSVPQCWPFCYWVGAVVDMYSRRVQGLAVFRREPTAKRIRTFLTRVVRNVGARPRYLVSDHDPVFKCAVIRDWCGRRTRQRFGAVGQKGSIAIL